MERPVGARAAGVGQCVGAAQRLVTARNAAQIKMLRHQKTAAANVGMVDSPQNLEAFAKRF